MLQFYPFAAVGSKKAGKGQGTRETAACENTALGVKLGRTEIWEKCEAAVPAKARKAKNRRNMRGKNYFQFLRLITHLLQPFVFQKH